MSSSDFYETVQYIRNCVKHGISLYQKHDEFKQRYPKLFEMLCDPECDQTMLNKLISLHKKVQNGKTDQKDADIAFGQVAVDTFVKPNLPRNSSKSWEII